MTALAAEVPAIALDRVFASVRAVHDLQVAEFGYRDHPDGTGSERFPLVLLDDCATAEDLARQATELCEQSTNGERAGGRRLTWRELLLEQTLHVLAKDDEPALRRQLLELAVVAVQWIEAIDSRGSRDAGGVG